MMRRGQYSHLLGFLLLVVVCGGGCIVGPYRMIHRHDLSAVGLDTHTRARLAGEVDPRPGDPRPASGLNGNLLVYPMTQPMPNEHMTPAGQRITLDELGLHKTPCLDGLERVEALKIRWENPRDNPAESKPIPDNSFKQTLLHTARQHGADLLLVYVVRDEKTDNMYPTLSLAQFLTLGLAPTILVHSESELEGALIDADTGFIYAVVSGEGNDIEISNAWNRYTNHHQAQDQAIGEALQQIFDQLETAWPDLHQAYP